MLTKGLRFRSFRVWSAEGRDAIGTANPSGPPLSDPSTQAGVALAKQHLAKLCPDDELQSIGQASVYFLYCQYSLRNPYTEAGETLSQSGAGFVISTDDKLLTAKRVIQP